MSNKLAVHGKMHSWLHNIKSSQTTEENEGTMLSYSGKAYALKEQGWLKTNTIMKKSLLRGKKAKSTEELRKQRNQHGGNRGSLVLYGCFRSLFSKSSTSTSGPTGQIWGSSPFHPAFPFVLKDTAWMPFCVSFPDASALSLSSHVEAGAPVQSLPGNLRFTATAASTGEGKGHQKTARRPCCLEEVSGLGRRICSSESLVAWVGRRRAAVKRGQKPKATGSWAPGWRGKISLQEPSTTDIHSLACQVLASN